MARPGWLVAGAAAIAFVCAWPVRTPGVKDTWISVRTPHLSIISSAGEKSTREVAQRLDRYVDGLAAFDPARVDPDVPVTVLIFRNDAAFAPFRPRQNGRTMDVAGYFQRADDENLIALSLETADAESMRVIFHEYAHALLARASVLWPLWTQEGVAEFYSAFQADNRRFALGDWIRSHPRLLLSQRLLPMRELFNISLQSPAYTGANQDLFYAQSWLVTHYMLAGDSGRRRPAFLTFLDDVAQGVAPAPAFARAVAGTDVDFQDALSRYLRDGRYATAAFGVTREAREITVTVQPMNDAAAEVAQGSLLMRVGRGDDANAYFARARQLDSKAPRLEESEGFLALSRGQFDAAEAHLRLAIGHDPGNHLAHYYLAETLRRRLMDQGRMLTADVARALSEPLRKVIALKPNFVRAYYLLGYAHSITGDDLAEGARLLQTAIRLAPPHRAAMLTLAAVQLKMREYGDARATAQAIVDAPDATDTMKSEARLIVDTAARDARR